MEDSTWADEVLDLLSCGSLDEAQRYAESKVQGEIDIGCRLVPGLFARLREHGEVKSAAEGILHTMAVHLPVDDMVIEMVNAFSNDDDPSIFHIVLELYKILFNREFSKRELYTDWCLQEITTYLKHNRSMDLPLQIQNFAKVLSFFENITKSNYLNGEVKSNIVKAILCIIGMNLDIQDFASNYSLVIMSLKNPNLILTEYLDSRNQNSRCDNSESDDDTSIPRMAIFVYNWLISGQYSVYSKSYIFRKAVALSSSLLSYSDYAINTIGINLLTHIQIVDSLSMQDLSRDVIETMRALNNVMIFSENKDTRLNARKCYENMLHIFDTKAQYHLLLNMRSSISHSGTLALVISKIKKIIEISAKVEDNQYMEYYKGKRLCDLLAIYCSLPDGPKTIVSKNADQILAALNLYRYLIATKNPVLHCPEMSIERLNSGYFDPLEKIVSSELESCNQSITEAEQGDLTQGIAYESTSVQDIAQSDVINSLYCARNTNELVQNTLQDIMEMISKSKPNSN